MVRQRSAKPLFPGSNPGAAFTVARRKQHPMKTLLILLSVWNSAQAFSDYPHFEFVGVSPGSFMMGCPKTEEWCVESGDELQHRATIVSGFEIQTTTVTNSLWEKVMGSGPAEEPDFPHAFSHDEAKAFIKKLNSLQEGTGFTYRFPTSAEWEYVARAGSETAYFFGDDPGRNPPKIGDYNYILKKYAWFSDNSRDSKHAVALKQANPLGLFDIYGNIWQWTSDVEGEGYFVVRGGDFTSFERSLRSAHKGVFGKFTGGGIRLVRTCKLADK